jgi:hypothetical protein
MSMRSEFAAELQEALPDDRVIDHAYELDGMDAHIPVVMLERTVIGTVSRTASGKPPPGHCFCRSGRHM